MRLDRVRGFVFDIDGTLVHRTGPGTVEAIPGAVEVLERIAASGRPFAVFTNGSHVEPDAFAKQLRAAGLPVADGQVLTPLCSVQMYLSRFRGGATVLPFVTEEARAYLEGAGVRLVDGRNGAHVDAVFVAHADRTDFDELERAARAVLDGARLRHGPVLQHRHVPGARRRGRHVHVDESVREDVVLRHDAGDADLHRAQGRRPEVHGQLDLQVGGLHPGLVLELADVDLLHRRAVLRPLPD